MPCASKERNVGNKNNSTIVIIIEYIRHLFDERLLRTMALDEVFNFLIVVSAVVCSTLTIEIGSGPLIFGCCHRLCCIHQH